MMTFAKIIGLFMIGWILVHWLTAGQDEIIDPTPNYNYSSVEDK